MALSEFSTCRAALAFERVQKFSSNKLLQDDAAAARPSRQTSIAGAANLYEVFAAAQDTVGECKAGQAGYEGPQAEQAEQAKQAEQAELERLEHGDDPDAGASFVAEQGHEGRSSIYGDASGEEEEGMEMAQQLKGMSTQEESGSETVRSSRRIEQIVFHLDGDEAQQDESQGDASEGNPSTTTSQERSHSRHSPATRARPEGSMKSIGEPGLFCPSESEEEAEEDVVDEQSAQADPAEPSEPEPSQESGSDAGAELSQPPELAERSELSPDGVSVKAPKQRRKSKSNPKTKIVEPVIKTRIQLLPPVRLPALTSRNRKNTEASLHKFLGRS